MKGARRFVILAIAFTISIVAVAGCASSHPGDQPQEQSQLDWGRHTYKISTSSSLCQEAFNRGLTMAYGFNYPAAELEFRRAAELDPLAAMPWWGVALVNGPHINYPIVPEKNARVAWDAMQKAGSRVEQASLKEQQLIAALAVRYHLDPKAERAPLDRAYADAMRNVYQLNGGDADIATLYAESLMDLHPWDLFESNGTAKPWAPEIIQVLEQAIALDDRHPGALHLYVHATEASSSPQRAEQAADTLGTLVPASGHLVHMPSHIYMRIGRLTDSAVANQTAIAADAKYLELYPKQGFFAVYMLHNRHFLTFTEMMRGRKAEALKSARAMLAAVPQQFKDDFSFVVDGYLTIALEVLVRFGDWQQVLAEPLPEAKFPLALAKFHFARATAFAALRQFKDAEEEKRLFVAATKKVPADATFGNNSAHQILRLAELVFDGELFAQKNDFPKAIGALNAAKQIEDELHYDEPPDWIIPVRHTLGITLLRAKQFDFAEQAYREDLQKFPKNGWSLLGLSKALLAQNRDKEARKVAADFEQAWKDADRPIASSCLCQKE